jgi:DNA-binding XRE family transcriptional regulator
VSSKFVAAVHQYVNSSDFWEAAEREIIVPKQSVKTAKERGWGQPLYVWRMQRELTQDEAAMRAGVSRDSWGRWETGVMLPNLRHYKRLVRLGVRV